MPKLVCDLPSGLAGVVEDGCGVFRKLCEVIQSSASASEGGFVSQGQQLISLRRPDLVEATQGERFVWVEPNPVRSR